MEGGVTIDSAAPLLGTQHNKWMERKCLIHWKIVVLIQYPREAFLSHSIDFY